MAADKKTLKVKLVHDWLTGMRGGEKVLELLCRRFPEAPLLTLLYVPGSVSQTISSHKIISSPLRFLPLAKSKYRNYLPLYPLLAEMNKASHCDVVISSSHAVAKAMIKRDGPSHPFHICYIHTPMRYVWDRFDDYFGTLRVGAFLSHFFFRPIAKLLQIYDRKTVDRVDLFVANSRFVADRVQRIYNRKALVLPPPVDLKKFANTKRSPQGWYLVCTALVPYKRTEQAIEACAQLSRPLKIVGTGPELNKLKKLAATLNSKVEFLGFVSDEDLVKYYSDARGLLFPGVEDFGIVPVEACAAGCPVIALREGGVLDSMTSETAHFYNEPTSSGLKNAILDFEKISYDPEVLRKRAAEFSEEKFMEKFEKILDDALTRGNPL